MLFDDRYKTIAKASEGIFRDKGSKFLAYAYPVGSEVNVKDHISALKALHPKARHHCWAVRFGPDRSIFRLNDDGEPSGTAGRPILNTILSYDLTNILVVVVRYFGGTLLGVSGLINAYKSATIEALNKAEIIELTVNDVYMISFNYLQMNDIMKIIKDHSLTILYQQFENTCNIELEIPKALLNTVISKFEKINLSTLTYLRTQ